MKSNIFEAKICDERFRDKYGRCASASDIYRFETKNQSLTDDLTIDRYSKKYSKQQIVSELEEFDCDRVAKDLVNMVSTDKVEDISDANKRTLVWADYWIERYKWRK